MNSADSTRCVTANEASAPETRRVTATWESVDIGSPSSGGHDEISQLGLDLYWTM
jgi:hypothetical protein